MHTYGPRKVIEFKNLLFWISFYGFIHGSDGLGPVEPLVVRGTSLEDYLSRILDGKKCVQPWCLVDCWWKIQCRLAASDMVLS